MFTALLAYSSDYAVEYTNDNIQVTSSFIDIKLSSTLIKQYCTVLWHKISYRCLDRTKLSCSCAAAALWSRPHTLKLSHTVRWASTKL